MSKLTDSAYPSIHLHRKGFNPEAYVERLVAMNSVEGASADQTPAAVAQPRCSRKCATDPAASETTTPDDEALEPQHRPWADLPADILGVVVARLALVEDRARLRSVCHAWRAAARLHRRPPPPLPLLVLSDFSFSSFSAEGTALTGARRRVPLPDPETEMEAMVEAGGVRCVGSIEGWLVAVERDTASRDSGGGGDLRCFLMNPFSQDVVRLPPPSAATHPADEHITTLPISINGASGMEMNCVINAPECVMSFRKVILSSSPDSSTGCCVAAAISMIDDTTKLALWRPGMESWCVCYGSCVRKFTDAIFCQGKLHIISGDDHVTDLFSLELSADDGGGGGLMVSRVDCREVEWAPDVDVTDGYNQNWSILEWRGKLLIVATYSDNADVWQKIVEVRVFEADLSVNPVRFTEIRSLDGDCIFVSPCSCKSFRSCQYADGVEADLVYFFDGYLTPEKNARPFYKFVYNLRDGTMAPFAEDIPKDKLRTPDGMLKHPTWLFPPE